MTVDYSQAQFLMVHFNSNGCIGLVYLKGTLLYCPQNETKVPNKCMTVLEFACSVFGNV